VMVMVMVVVVVVVVVVCWRRGEEISSMSCDSDIELDSNFTSPGPTHLTSWRSWHPCLVRPRHPIDHIPYLFSDMMNE
jgi:hypothetical protein